MIQTLKNSNHKVHALFERQSKYLMNRECYMSVNSTASLFFFYPTCSLVKALIISAVMCLLDLAIEPPSVGLLPCISSGSLWIGMALPITHISFDSRGPSFKYSLRRKNTILQLQRKEAALQQQTASFLLKATLQVMQPCCSLFLHVFTNNIFSAAQILLPSLVPWERLN